jgi:hypothetical protein
MSRRLNKARDASVQAPQRLQIDAPATPAETCDLCGSEAVEWRSCKLICRSCRAIVRSCADL